MYVIIWLWPYFIIGRWIWRLAKWCVGCIWNRIKKKEKGEFYTADIWHSKKHIRRSTFFPSTWTPAQVSDSIKEAYDDFQSKGSIDCAKKGDKYIVRGLTKEGIEIEIHLSDDATVLTAYPIF